MFFNALSSISTDFLQTPGESPLMLQPSEGEPLHDFLLALLTQLPGQIMPDPALEAPPDADLNPLPRGELLPEGGKPLPLALRLEEGRILRSQLVTPDAQRSLDADPARLLPPVLRPVLMPEPSIPASGRAGARTGGALPLEALLDIPQVHTQARSPEVVTPVPRLVHFEGLSPSPSPSPILTLSHPVTAPDWSEALGDRVLWLANQRIQAAQIRLHPPHLGPLEVRVSVVDDTASVTFGVHNALTREALEAALPQLREMLAQQGLQLTDANVSHRGLGGEQQHRHAPDASVDGDADAADPGPHEEMPRRRLGLVDDYA